MTTGMHQLQAWVETVNQSFLELQRGGKASSIHDVKPIYVNIRAIEAYPAGPIPLTWSASN